jgi:hypothetical protein
MSTVTLEDSVIWKLSKEVSDKVREAVKPVPYSEYYVFASPAIQNAVLVTSDLAYAVGKGAGASPYDYQAARGHLFTVKGLVLMANEQQFIEVSKGLMADFDRLQALIEKELARVEKAQEEKEK